MRKLDLKGQRFGRLTAVRENGKMYGRRVAWLCLCDCGSEKTIPGEKLRDGMVRSCGCLLSEANSLRTRTHGQTGNYRKGIGKTKEYRAWCHAKARCHCKTDRKYPIYGARGIVMCDRWRDSFEAFFSDMGKAPSGAHSIDRINVDGNYEPGNCRWATPKEQRNNQRPRAG
jgi:hypothetical protein